jgi:hypothetical protein
MEGAPWPIGFKDRLIVKGHNEAGPKPMESRQLGFDVDPPDALTIEEVQQIERNEIAATTDNNRPLRDATRGELLDLADEARERHRRWTEENG